MSKLLSFAALQKRLGDMLTLRYGKWVKGSLIVAALLAGVELGAWVPGEEFVFRFLAWFFVIALPFMARQPIGLFGLVMVVYVILLLGLAFIETSPAVKEIIGGWRAGRSAPGDALAAAQSAAQQAQQKLRHMEWWYHWRVRQIPDVRPLGDADLREARKEISRLHDPLGSLHETFNAIVQQACEPLYTSARGSFLDGLDDSLREELISPSLRLILLLRDPGDEDARQVFRAFWERYKYLRPWVFAAAEHHRLDIRRLPAYPAWRNSDATFFTKVSDFATIPAMSELRQEIKRDSEYERYPDDLPEPLTDWSIEKVAERLRDMPEPEREFLGVFLVDSPDYDWRGSDLLRADVFHAGRALAGHGVLTHRVYRPGDRAPEHIFTIPGDAADTIKAIRFLSEVKLQPHIVIRQDRIRTRNTTP